MFVEKVSVYSNRGMIQRVPRRSHRCKQGFGLTGVLSLHKHSFFSPLLTANLLLNLCWINPDHF